MRVFSRKSKVLSVDPYGAPTAAVSADVIIIGDGIVGLSTAFELGRSGASVVLVGARREGAASRAAAGLLAPSVGTQPANVSPFFFDSLGRYPAFVECLRRFEPALRLVDGLIDLSRNASTAAYSRHLTPQQLATLEPALTAPNGATLYAADGAIDAVLLVQALRKAVSHAASGVIATEDPARAVELSNPLPAVLLESGARVTAPIIVLAAGAWAPGIGGLPRPVPVTPLKGQMLAVDFSGLAHAVMADDVYLVPRRRETVIGATVERVGFDVGTTAAAIEGLRRAATEVCPRLGVSRITSTWAGIRPATPDMLPIIGPDPTDRRLIYACGHSKNGILLAPATAAAVCDLAQTHSTIADLTPFAIARFD
jgi:glycine/D-amino acid oxidase-like deaminating enzyme